MFSAIERWRREAQLLLDHGDAEAARLARRQQRELAAVDADAALVGPQHAGQQVDQRALAGAVLAEQRVDAAGQDVDRHAR